MSIPLPTATERYRLYRVGTQKSGICPLRANFFSDERVWAIYVQHGETLLAVNEECHYKVMMFLLFFYATWTTATDAKQTG